MALPPFPFSLALCHVTILQAFSRSSFLSFIWPEVSRFFISLTFASAINSRLWEWPQRSDLSVYLSLSISLQPCLPHSSLYTSISVSPSLFLSVSLSPSLFLCALVSPCPLVSFPHYLENSSILSWYIHGFSFLLVIATFTFFQYLTLSIFKIPNFLGSGVKALTWCAADPGWILASPSMTHEWSDFLAMR